MQIDNIEIEDKNYKVLSTIGQGGSAIVYLVSEEKTKELYAVKVIQRYKKIKQKQMVDDQIKIQKMLIDNNNIIKCYTSQEKLNKKYILFQLGQCSLRNRLDYKQFVEEDYYDMIMQVARGLSEIHAKGLMHRDIKPENIILKDGIYKITDFGISSLKDKDSSTVGTPLYWPPEILFEKQQDFTQKIDVWSLGIVAFQAYFLINPFYYEDYGVQKSMMDVVNELRENISHLTPNFTIKRFIKYLQQKGHKKKASFIHKKLEATTNQLINTFQQFFELQPDKRPPSDLMYAIFISLSEKVKQKHPSRCKIKKKDLPFEIAFFAKTIDLFYEINSKLKYPKTNDVEFALQLAIWMIIKALYQNQDFIQFQCEARIKSHKGKHKKQNWEQIRSILCAYYFQLKQGDHQFYQNLHIIRYRVLVCGVWNILMRNTKKYCQMLQKKTHLEIQNIEDMPPYIPTFTEHQFNQIQDCTIGAFFY